MSSAMQANQDLEARVAALEAQPKASKVAAIRWFANKIENCALATYVTEPNTYDALVSELKACVTAVCGGPDSERRLLSSRQPCNNDGDCDSGFCDPDSGWCRSRPN